MIEIRRAAERGYANHGWLESFHSFSFADYYDPAHMGFGPLRVINDDYIAPGAGFPTHPHRDMEILTYLLDGGLAHRDSMGNGTQISPGDLQRMSAGSGVLHSEYHHGSEQPTHLLQIWIQPDVRGIAPEYEQRNFPVEERRGRLQLVASPDGRDGSLRIHQDARLSLAWLDGGDALTVPLAPGRRGYLHLARGSVQVGGMQLAAGDALKVEDETSLTLERGELADVLWFDLP